MCATPQVAASNRARLKDPQRDAGLKVHGEKPTVAEEDEHAASQRLQLVFPTSLTARQRAVLHDVAARAGLHHTSHGDGPLRHLRLGSGPQEVPT